MRHYNYALTAKQHSRFFPTFFYDERLSATETRFVLLQFYFCFGLGIKPRAVMTEFNEPASSIDSPRENRAYPRSSRPGGLTRAVASCPGLANLHNSANPKEVRII